MPSKNDIPDLDPNQLSPIRAVMRATIGGVMVGIRTLRKGARALAESEKQKVKAEKLDDTVEPSLSDTVEILAISPDSDSIQLIEMVDGQDDQTLGYVLIGMMLDASDQIGRLGRRMGRDSSVFGRRVDRLVSPITGSRAFNPLRKRFERLVARGDDTVERWRRMGQNETYQGQKMLTSATISTVDNSIDYITQQPEVVNIVKTRGTTLTGRVLRYLRSIFISLDTVLEGKFRELLKLKPRRELPLPSEEIREGASFRFLQPDDEPVDYKGTRIGDYTGLATRIMALFIDLLLLAFIFTFSIWFVSISVQMLGINLDNIFLFMSQDLIDRIGEGLLRVLTQSTLAVGFFYIYNTLSWVLFGQSIGAALMGYRILEADGSPPGVVRSLLRVSIGYALSLSLLFVGVWLILFDPQRRSLHDRIFHTYVVYTWDAQPSERFLKSQAQKYE